MSFGMENVLAVLEEVRPIITRRYGARLERSIGARADVGDLYQVVSLKAIQGISGFAGKSETELRHWVLQIARNTYRRMRWTNVDCLKRSTAVEGVLIGVPYDGNSSGYQPAERSERVAPAEIVEQCAMVYRAIDRLPDRQREAVRMKFVSGLSYEEIAEHLGCSISAAHKLVGRGLSSVRSSLVVPVASTHGVEHADSNADGDWVQLGFEFLA